jgi:hypothetical protein
MDPLSRRLAGRAEHLPHSLVSQHCACRACRLCCGNVPGRACAPLGVRRMQAKGVPTMILPKVRDPRFVTIRRSGTLPDSDHHFLALWAASSAEHVLVQFESAQPEDPRPRQAIEHARAWVRGEVTMTQARAAGGHTMSAARDLRGAARHATYAAGQAGAVAHVAAHELGAAAYAIKAVRAAASESEGDAAGDSSASGSVTSSRLRFASSSLTTSGCGTTSAGRCLTAKCASGRQHCPQAHWTP